jgi:hypothetical protein
MELWLGRTDAPDSVRAVEGFAPVPRHEPVWSADGSRLLAIGNEQGRQGLYEVDAESGRARRLPAPAATPMYAAYTDDSDRLLVGSDSGEGRLQVTLFDTSARPWRKLAALQDVALVRFDARSGAVYFTRLTKPGTWRTDASLGRVEPADMERPHRTDEYKRWTIGADGPWFLDESEGCGVGWVRMGAPATASGVCLQRDAGAWPTAPSVNAAGTAVYATLTVSSNADIGLADISPLLAVRR